MRVFDVCPFWNELDVLEVRLATLSDVVDVFVVCEAPWTYAGTAKPLMLTDSLTAEPERWAPWADRLRVVVASDPDIRSQPYQHTGEAARWVRENHQRRELQRGMTDLERDDVILLADCDEILRPEIVSWYADADMRLILRPCLPMHVYLPNWRWAWYPIPVIARMFRGERILPVEDGGHGLDLEVIRQSVGLVMEQPVRPMDDPASAWGWHLSYLGGVDAVMRKLVEAAHPEMLGPDTATISNIRRSIEEGGDVFGRDRPIQWVDDSCLPDYLVEHKDSRFAGLFHPEGREAPCPES